MDDDMKAMVQGSILGHAHLEDLTSIAQDGLQIQPMDGAFLNHVCRVTSPDGSSSCVVKVFRNHCMALGPSIPLETERSARELEANEHFNQLSSGCCPKVFFHDDASNIVCMQDLNTHSSWGESLLTSCDLQVGAKVADVLVSLHSASHILKIGQEDFSKLQHKFKPFPQQIDFLCDWHFTKPFLEDHRKNIPRADSVRSRIDELVADAVVSKAAAMAKEWLAVGQGDCCIHSDLHLGSIMSNGKDIKFIDLECARVGPPAFDVALLVCNYLLLYHYHQELTHQDDGVDDGINHAYVRRHLLDLICITLSRYMDGMGRALGEAFDHHHVWKQVLLFLGVEIIAWISGPPSLKALDSHPEAQLNCLNTAFRILHKQSLSLDTEDLSNLIHQP